MKSKLNADEKENILSKFKGFLNGIYCDPEIESEYMPHFLIYKKFSKNKADCYCTHCQEFFEAPVLAKSHGEVGKCPRCEFDITYLCEGYGRKKIYAKRNFVRIKNISDTEVIAVAINVRAKFFNPSCSIILNREDVSLDYDYGLVNLYYFTKGYAVRFALRHTGKFYDDCSYEWVETRSELEPVFETNYMGRGADNSYTIMDKDDDEIKKSFFKYVLRYADGNSTIDYHYISFLVLCSQHPNVEYLMSAGFGSIIESRLLGTMAGLRINWKSNNLNKMLGLNKNDINVLRDCDIYSLVHYKELKKYFKGKASADQLIQCVKLGSDNIKYLCENTCLSLKNVLDYSKDMKSRVIDWKDYISQCIKLGYNLNDTAISKPKHLDDAHERLSSIILFENNKAKNDAIAKRSEELQKLRFECKRLGIMIVIPENISDIVNEGKRLNHCVASYADDHSDGELSIVFLRSMRKPDVPYYTMEISKEGEIVQCRGYRNNRFFDKPQKIIDFEEEYQQYLDILYNRKKESITA